MHEKLFFIGASNTKKGQQSSSGGQPKKHRSQDSITSQAQTNNRVLEAARRERAKVHVKNNCFYLHVLQRSVYFIFIFSRIIRLVDENHFLPATSRPESKKRSFLPRLTVLRKMIWKWQCRDLYFLELTILRKKKSRTSRWTRFHSLAKDPHAKIEKYGTPFSWKGFC